MSAASIVVGLAVWELIGRAKPLVLAPLSQVVVTAKDAASNGTLWIPTAVTLRDLLIGLAIAIAIGVPMGVVMATNPTARKVANMYLYWLFALPEVAVIPFYIVALGYGETARQFVIVLFALPVVAQRALVGASEVPTPLTEMAKCFELSRINTFRKITVKWALPSIMAGVRLGYLRALIGVVAAGIFAQLFGLGGRVWLSEQNYDVPGMFMYIAVLALLGLVGNAALSRIDQRANKWMGETGL